MNNTRINIIILAIVSFLMFSNTLNAPFIWDDKGTIENLISPEYQKHLKNPFFFLTISYWKDYTKFHDVDAYVPVSPLRMLTMNIDYKIWGLNPSGFHLTNILLHISNVILLYIILLRITKSKIISFFSSLLFALHPMHTESLNWIKNRVDLIATLFLFISFYSFIRFVEDKGKRFYIITLVMFIFALLAKEISITFPALIFFYIIYFVDRENRKSCLIKTIPVWIIAGVYFITTQIILKKSLHTAPVLHLDLYTNILLVFKTLATYLGLITFPFSFNLERDIELPAYLFEFPNILSVIVVLFSSYLIYYFYKKERIVSFGLLAFFITISPVSNIIYLAPRPIAEQRLYLPSAGYLLFFVSLLYFIYKRFNFNNERFLRVFLYSLSIGFFTAGFIRNFDWKDELKLWETTVKSSPSNARAWVNYGQIYFIRGELEKARECFEKALKISPDFIMANRAMAFYYMKKGDGEKMVMYFRKSGDVN